MKKLLLSAVLLASFNSIFAFATQGNWRWRKDDGSQTTATWLAAQNTAPVIASTAESLRLRIELFNNIADPGGLLDDAQFEDSSDAVGGHWDTIKVVADEDDAFVLVGTSPNVIDLEATTQQLTGPHYATFVAGKMIVSSDTLPPYTLNANQGSEYEYVIKPTANLQPNVTYYFRVNAANYPLDIPPPSLTTAAVLPVNMTDFLIKKEGKRLKLTWSVASQQNNDRFEIERSEEGTVWKTIATVKGSGTSSQAQDYSAYDEQPVNGINYYRLKQFDISGHSTVSVIRSFKIDQRLGALVSVSPNPSKGTVSFKLVNRSASNLSVILSDANGKVVFTETFKDIQENTLHRLNLKQQPAPGMYIMKLKSDNVSESVKIMVQ